ncbi:MAG: hypothetical protein LUE61_02615, partial [Clostridiales bacterium]|nr:hypothetical protein [Clostridiales bacterium]
MTWICPVCRAEGGDTQICPKCGFDRSRDYERYGTLTASLPAAARPVSALAAAWQQKLVPGALRCPNCGGVTFYVSTKLRQHICTNCHTPAGVNWAPRFKTESQWYQPARGEAGRGFYRGPVLACGRQTTIAIREDGTVAVAGDNRFDQYSVRDWRNIIAVTAGDSYLVGLRSDGSVTAVGENDDGQCNVAGWANIVAVTAGANHTVAMVPGGAVIAVGRNTFGQCNLDGWTAMAAVAAGYHHTVGLRCDGTVAAAGGAFYGQCSVDRWTNIVAVAAG